MDEEEKRILKENNEMIKELLVIARKYTSPEYIKQKNNSDFFWAVLANLFAKKLEKLLRL